MALSKGWAPLTFPAQHPCGIWCEDASAWHRIDRMAARYKPPSAKSEALNIMIYGDGAAEKIRRHDEMFRNADALARRIDALRVEAELAEILEQAAVPDRGVW